MIVTLGLVFTVWMLGRIRDDICDLEYGNDYVAIRYHLNQRNDMFYCFYWSAAIVHLDS